MGKSTKSETKQTNEPPAWAKPLLEKSASEGMRLYDEGSGYNVYSGPTQAGFSDPSLGGMNSMLAATGYQGAPVTNESVLNTPQIQQARQMIEQMMTAKAQKQPQQAAAPAPVQQRQKMPDFGSQGGQGGGRWGPGGRVKQRQWQQMHELKDSGTLTPVPGKPHTFKLW